MKPAYAWTALWAATVLALAPGSAARRTGFDPIGFLKSHAEFSASDISKLQRRDIITRSLQADGDEVAIVGATPLNVSTSVYLDKFRDIKALRGAQQTLGAGRFSEPATAADLHTLTVTEQDVADARDCRPGDCKLKLDAAGIAKVRQVDLRGPDARARLSQVFREYLSAYAAQYQRSGDAALMHYADGSRPVTIRDNLARIAGKMPFLSALAPRIAPVLRQYSGGDVADVEHFFYWSQDQVGRKAVMSINHALIRQPAADLTVVATRQVYASHYFTGSVNVTLLSAADQHKAPTLMIHINRSRIDAFSGVLGPVRRTLARSRSKAAAERMLTALRTTLEGGR